MQAPNVTGCNDKREDETQCNKKRCIGAENAKIRKEIGQKIGVICRDRIHSVRRKLTETLPAL
jgi:hypothetical protein